VDLRGSDLHGVDFGERAPMASPDPDHWVRAMAWHPALPGVAAVGAEAGVRLWAADPGAALGPTVGALEGSCAAPGTPVYWMVCFCARLSWFCYAPLKISGCYIDAMWTNRVLGLYFWALHQGVCVTCSVGWM
jgi:hypothetical protein